MKGKVVLITGGTRGIGKATAIEFVKLGANVIVNYVNNDKAAEDLKKEIEKMRMPIFEICLEQTHINMAITKILGMIRAKKIKKIIFASVDKSPHCIQLHYIQDEIRKLGFELNFVNYVALDNALIKISKETIALSKNLSKLSLISNK